MGTPWPGSALPQHLQVSAYAWMDRRRDATDGGLGRGGIAVAVGEEKEGKFERPGWQHLCSTVHAESTPCPHSAGSYTTLQN